MDLARLIYMETGAMPKSEAFALTSQMRRAATSIPMNIAEGFGQWSRPAFVHGLRLASGSLFELMTSYELATSLELIHPSDRVWDWLKEEDRLLGALIQSLPVNRRVK
jgi:four helix bundle protein